MDVCTHLLFLDEIHEVGPLDLHRLTLPVVQSQHEVEKVGLAQVRGRLLLKVSPGQTHSTADTQAGASRCQIRSISVWDFFFFKVQERKEELSE